jgi:hypothetical protein
VRTHEGAFLQPLTAGASLAMGPWRTNSRLASAVPQATGLATDFFVSQVGGRPSLSPGALTGAFASPARRSGRRCACCLHTTAAAPAAFTPELCTECTATAAARPLQPSPDLLRLLLSCSHSPPRPPLAVVRLTACLLPFSPLTLLPAVVPDLLRVLAAERGGGDAVGPLLHQRVEGERALASCMRRQAGRSSTRS